MLVEPGRSTGVVTPSRVPPAGRTEDQGPAARGRLPGEVADQPGQLDRLVTLDAVTGVDVLDAGARVAPEQLLLVAVVDDRLGSHASDQHDRDGQPGDGLPEIDEPSRRILIGRSAKSQLVTGLRGVGKTFSSGTVALAGLDLDVNIDNVSAIGFYRRLGFLVTGAGKNSISGKPVHRMSWRP